MASGQRPVTTLSYTGASFDSVGRRIGIDPVAAEFGGGTVPPGLLAVRRNPVPAGVDPAGATTTFEYDRFANLRRTTTGAGVRTVMSFDELGRRTGAIITDLTTGSVTEMSYRYDLVGNVVESSEPAVTNAVTGETHRATTITEYDANNNPTRTTERDLAGNDADRVTLAEYDNMDRAKRTQTPEGVWSELDYDSMGRIEFARDPRATIQTTYTPGGEPDQTILVGYTNPQHPAAPRNIVVNDMDYYPNGRLLRQTDALQRSIRSDYDSKGRNYRSVLED